MDVVVAIAGLASLTVVILIMGLWWVSATNRRIRDRLQYEAAPQVDTRILRVDPWEGDSAWRVLVSPLAALTEQAGYDTARTTNVLLLMGFFALAGGVGAWFRLGGIVWGVLVAIVTGSLPVVYLFYKRHQRLRRFEQQFPDALDMMTRAIRAGHAMSGAIQVVGDEMPDPAGQEFRRVSEEIRLGLDQGEALSRLRRRVITEDARFFCNAIGIHRSAGGNLAEILDRLSEVIRERFKLLSHARVLSAQHRWTAVCVGLSPVVFAIMFQALSPGYFDPLLASPLALYLIGGGILLEAIGFLIIWRIAKIKV